MRTAPHASLANSFVVLCPCVFRGVQNSFRFCRISQDSEELFRCNQRMAMYSFGVVMGGLPCVGTGGQGQSSPLSGRRVAHADRVGSFRRPVAALHRYDRHGVLHVCSEHFPAREAHGRDEIVAQGVFHDLELPGGVGARAHIFPVLPGEDITHGHGGEWLWSQSCGRMEIDIIDAGSFQRSDEVEYPGGTRTGTRGCRACLCRFGTGRQHMTKAKICRTSNSEHGRCSAAFVFTLP